MASQEMIVEMEDCITTLERHIGTITETFVVECRLAGQAVPRDP